MLIYCIIFTTRLAGDPSGVPLLSLQTPAGDESLATPGASLHIAAVMMKTSRHDVTDRASFYFVFRIVKPCEGNIVFIFDVVA